MEKRVRVLLTSSLLVLVIYMVFTFPLPKTQASPEHVYYGYVPPSTDIAGGETDYPRQVDEIIQGTVVNYTVPSGDAILDVVGLEDDTSIEIWDIYANQKISSATVDKFEKKTFYIPFGTFFKITASARVVTLLNGGQNVFEPEGSGSDAGGTSTFYPSVTGGFRGREFIFQAAPGTHPYAYSADRVGYNFYLMALEDTDWSLSDTANIWSTTGHLSQRSTRTTIIQSRKHHNEYHNGAGNDVVFYLTTSGDVEVSCSSLDDYVAPPAITGGYIGRLFYAPVAVTLDEPGRTAAFMVVPLEEGKVTVYDKDLNVIAERSFTTEEVADMDYWYHSLGIGRFDLIAESTGDIAFMVGQTQTTAEIDYLGDDITFVGSRPNQEIRFYAPTMAVIFAPESLSITIDGGAPIQMAKDEFRLLESGVHSISANRHVMVEILAASTGWTDWGSYLIEASDVDVTYEAPEGFTSKPVNYTMYIVAGAVAAIVVAVALVFVMRRRRPSRV